MATTTDTEPHRGTETESPTPDATAFGLVKGTRLLELVFPDKDSRPSLRWLERLVQCRRVPFIKIGRLTFFDVPEFQQALRTRNTVNVRGGAK